MHHDGNNFAPGGAIDVGDILVGLWRRKMMIVMFALVAVGLAFAFVKAASPKYSATAKVLVENLETPFTKAQDPDRRDSRIDERDVLSQVEVANSPDIARKVWRSLDGEMEKHFNRSISPGLLGRAMILAGFSENPARMDLEQRALAKFEKNSAIYAIPNSKVIVLQFSSSRADIAAAVANRLARTYVRATRTAQSHTTDRAQTWLAVQVDALRQKVVESEVAAEQFRARAGLVRGATATLSSQELSELNSQMILASASKAEALARAASIRELLAKTGSVDAASDVMNSALIQRLREQQVLVRRNFAELSATYLDNHPRIKSVKRELADLNRQVRSEALKIVNSLEQQARIAASREASLRASLEKLKTKAMAVGVEEVKLRALEREATANRQLLESFLTRYSDAASRVKPESQPGLARIIATATVPSAPSFPKKGPIISLAGIGGIALGLGIAFLLEVMTAAGSLQQAQAMGVHQVPQSQQSAQPQQSEQPQPQPEPNPQRVVATPCGPDKAQTAVAEAPTAPVEKPAPRPLPAIQLVCAIPRSPDVNTSLSNAQSTIYGTNAAYAGPAKTLSAWVLDQHQSNGVKRIAMTGLPKAEPDSATAAVATARYLAEQGLRVVVVDADNEYGCMSYVVGLRPSAGLSELLSGKATFSDVVERDKLSSAHLVRSGQKRPGGLSKNMPLILEAFDHAYDLVILSCGGTRFPAEPDSTGITACQSAIVFAAEGQAAEAGALCGVLMRAGLDAAHIVRLDNAVGFNSGTVGRVAASL